MADLRAPKGMNDVLPDEIGRWHLVEKAFRETMHLHGFREVRTPYLESTALFSSAIGEGTDVVEKEMYSFAHHKESLTLRPEGTAGAARAYVEHKVHNQEPVSKWYYLGPMFRGERPAKGRYRQFSQLGAEVFGDPGPAIDAEVIDLLYGFIGRLGIPGAEVLINSIGSEEARAAYRAALVSYLTPLKEKLSEDSQRRLEKNPLRILDSKAPADIECVQDAPGLDVHLTAEDRKHFDDLKRSLDALGTPYRVEPRLVRGLDYYSRTLFEIKAAKELLGAGDTVAGGGRYDRMVEAMGGPKVPAFGFGAGLERLLIASSAQAETSVVDAFVAPLGDGDGVRLAALRLAKSLRAAGVRTEADLRGGGAKSLLRRATTLGAAHAIIIGDRELESGLYALKDLAAHAQREATPEDIVRDLALLRTEKGSS
ncbi:MAG: histidine--tRNA ligase [Polyangiaceae bacterium]|nr:histidine--tRNA ligase [Polyangiaceae bacterium]